LRVEHVVKQELAEEAEDADCELGGREGPQARPGPQAIGEFSAGDVAETQPRHERRDDDGDRIDIRAGEEDEQALPDHLVKDGCKTGQEKNQERQLDQPSMWPTFLDFAYGHSP